MTPMKNSLLKPKGLIGRIPFVVLTVFIAGCESGTEGPSMPTTAAGTQTLPISDTATIENGLPDFSIVDITSSSTTENNDLRVQATITNLGDIGATVPIAWFVVSTNTEDNGSYQYTAVTMMGVGNQVPFLEPGETGVFDAVNRSLGVVHMQMRRSGTHYGHLWLNPDLSDRYLNPEPVVVESHVVVEKDYTNNRSNLLTFESIMGPNTGIDCTVDAYEENDSVETATLITSNTIYNFNACDEGFEMMAIDLKAGTTYEIMQYRNPNDLSRIWSLTVVDPEGRYILRDIRSSLLVPEISGRYLIITQTDSSQSSELVLEVLEQ